MLEISRKLPLLALLVLPLLLTVTGCSLHSIDANKIGNTIGLNRETKPRIMLWAWEAPGDLRWVDSRDVGVAFLAETITLRKDDIWAKPRMQPLRVNPDTFLTAVIRIESSSREKPNLSDAQINQLVANIKKKSQLPGVRAVQIDFDAKLSDRDFYRTLLTRLREELPADVDLSMTALASWCIGDRWLKGVSADEIVPMFFSMGADTREVAHYLKSGKTVHDFSRAKAIGLAENSSEVIESISDSNKKQLLNGRRVYLFSARAWTKDRMERLLRKVAI